MKKTITVLLCVVLALVLAGGIWQLATHIKSKQYLVSIDTSSICVQPLKSETDDFVQLSETKMHYQVYGDGKENIILVHGNGGSVESLREAASYLANDYTVYLPESRCHGQSSDPGEISYQLMASDLKEFVDALKIKEPIIIGHSDGGINAIAFAANYPDVPKAIISAGANSNPGGLKGYSNLTTVIANLIHPDKLNVMMLTEPNFTAEYMGEITCPAYIVCGEFDMIKLSDSVFIHESIKGSDFAVFKGENHGSYTSHNGKKFCAISTKWLNEKFN